MAVKKRKSNWYIYLITFIIASVVAAMVMSILWDMFFPHSESKNTSGIKSDLPDASNNIITLFMLSEEKAANPTRYMIVSFQPADEAIICIPLRSNMQARLGSTVNTLDGFYTEGGINSVLYAVEGAVGVKCDRYVKADRESFVSMIDTIGRVSINCAYDVLANDGSVALEAGSHSMTGNNLYNYINYDNPSYGDDYQSLVAGSAAVSIINSNMNGLSSTVIQSYFTKLQNTMDTNFTIDDYTKRQRALVFTSTETLDPGRYYIPYGEITDGVFILSENSKATILDRLNID